MRKLFTRLLPLIALVTFAAALIPAKVGAFQSFNVNGSTYAFPDVDDTDWGQNVTDWAQAVSTAVSAVSRSTIPIGAISNSTTTLGLIASNTNYLTVLGSTDTKLGGLNIFGTISASSGSIPLFQGSTMSIAALLTASSATFNQISSSNGILGGGSTFYAVHTGTMVWRNVKYNMPPADGTVGQLFTTNGLGGISWTSPPTGGGAGALFQNGQSLVPIMTTTTLVTGNVVSVDARSASSATITDFNYREVDQSTGVKARFEWQEGVGSYTMDSIQASKMPLSISSYGYISGMNTAASVWLSSCVNNTPCVSYSSVNGYTIFKATGSFSFHAGDSSHGAMSISVWVRPYTISGAQVFVWKGNTGGYEYDISYGDVANQIRAKLFTSAAGDAGTISSTASVLNTNAWNHIVWIVDKPGARNVLFVNNNPMTVSPTAFGTTAAGTDPLTFGRENDSTGNSPCLCQVDRAKFFDYGLSVADVDRLFKEKIYPEN